MPTSDPEGASLTFIISLIIVPVIPTSDALRAELNMKKMRMCSTFLAL